MKAVQTTTTNGNDIPSSLEDFIKPFSKSPRLKPFDNPFLNFHHFVSLLHDHVLGRLCEKKNKHDEMVANFRKHFDNFQFILDSIIFDIYTIGGEARLTPAEMRAEFDSIAKVAIQLLNWRTIPDFAFPTIDPDQESFSDEAIQRNRNALKSHQAWEAFEHFERQHYFPALGRFAELTANLMGRTNRKFSNRIDSKDIILQTTKPGRKKIGEKGDENDRMKGNMYDNIICLFKKGLTKAKILSYLKTAEGKELSLQIDSYIRQNPKTQNGKNRIRRNVIHAAYQILYEHRQEIPSGNNS